MSELAILPGFPAGAFRAQSTIDIPSHALNRSTHSADNLFLRSYAALKGKSVRLTGTLILLSVLPLLAVLALSIGLGYVKLKQDMAEQANAVGQELARQVAASVADPMAANDNLSLNIILAQWNQNPLITHTAVYTLDNRVVAEAGQRQPEDRLAPGKGRFVAAMHFQDAIIGQLHLSLAKAPFSAPAQNLLNMLILSVLIIAVIAGLIAWRLALRLRQVLAALGDWHGDSDLPAPGSRRKDEIGDLSRRLAARRIVDSPAPAPQEDPAQAIDTIEADPVLLAPTDETGPSMAAEAAESDSEPTDELQREDSQHEEGAETEPVVGMTGAADETPRTSPDETSEPIEPATAKHALLAVRLGNQEGLRRLPRQRLVALLERYREQVWRASQMFEGELDVLDDGTSVLTFREDPESEGEELTRAFSCGELLRVLGHDLQVGIADTGVNLYLQLATCQTAEPDATERTEDGELTQVGRMLELLQFSRNLLLLDASQADDASVRERAVVRKLASKPGAFCVERLNEPYQAVLERNLNQLYRQRQD